MVPEPLIYNPNDRFVPTDFVDVVHNHLVSSNTVLSKFQHNDEKDDADYEKEEEMKK